MDESLGSLNDNSNSLVSDSDFYHSRDIKDDITTSLQQENAQLELQNSTLKSQFEQAIELANQSKILQSELLKEKEEKRQMNEQIAILNAQIELLSTSNTDLNRKIDENQRKYEEQFSLKENQTVKETNQIKIQLQSRIEDLIKDNEEMKMKINQYEVKDKVDRAQKQQLLSTLSNIYNTPFQSFEEACSFVQNHQNSFHLIQTNNENQLDQILLHLENLKQKYSLEKKKRRQAEKVAKSLSSDLEEVESELKKNKEIKDETQQLRAKISDLEEEKSLVNADYEHQIKLLTTKNENLLNEIKQLRSSPTQGNLTAISASQQQNIPQIPQIGYLQQTQDSGIPIPPKKVYEPCTVCHKHEELAETNTMLLEQLEELNKTKNRIASELEEVNEKYNEQSQQYFKLKGEHDLLASQLKSQEVELQHKKEAEEKSQNLQNQLIQLKAENKGLKQANSNQKKDNQELKNQISTQSADISILKQNIETQKETERKLMNEIDELEEKLTQSHNDFMRIQQVNTPVIKASPEDIVPPESFRTIIFDEPLNFSIEKIANTQSIHPQTKIQTIYKTIQSYFSNKQKEYEKSVLQEQKESNEMIDGYQKAFIDISIIINGSPQCKSVETLVDNIQTLKEAYDNLNREFKSQSKLLGYIRKAFDFNKDTQLQEQINNKCSYIEQLKNGYLKQTKKLKSMKQMIRSMHSNHQKETNCLCQKIMQKDAKIKALEEQATQLTEAIKDHKIEASKMKQQQREFLSDHEETLRKLKTQYDERINELNIAHSAQIGEQSQQILNLKDSNSALEQKNKKLEENIFQIKKAYESQKTTLLNLREMQQKAELDSKAALSNALNQYTLEKETILDNHNKEIDHCMETQKNVKQQLINITNEKEGLQRKLEKHETTIKMMKETIASLNHTILVKDAEMQKSIQLVEAAKAATISQAEVKLAAKLNEQQTVFDIEKQRLFAFAFEHFSSFFTPNQQINEQSYKNLILQVSDKLKRE